MRFVLIVVSMMMLGGCSLPPGSGLLRAAPPTQEPTLGMTRPQVSAMMTHNVIIGYAIDPATGEARPLEAKSLYSTEIVSVGKETWLVDSYITGVSQAGHSVTEAGLTPMIFRNDILSGKGRDALKALKAGARQ